MAIEAVIWDFGGVFTPSPFVAAHAYARAQGVEPDTFVRIVFGDYDTDSDHAWHRLERGEIAFTTALDEIGATARASGVRFDAAEMFASLRSDEVDRSVVTDYVRGLRGRGIRNAILTNNIREYGDHWRASLAVDELFDLVVDSCLEGIRKPDPLIYERALERLGVEPSAAVFLDDFEQNVVAARALGMHGIVVGPDPRVALVELDLLVT